MAELCSIESKDGIAIVRMDRPPANALDPTLGRALIETAEQLASEPPRAVILTGTAGSSSPGST